VRYTFSDFTLDADTRELSRSGDVVPLSPKAFDFLELLLRERPRAVSVTRLRAALWPSTHVGSASLHVLVSQVRAALGDDAAAPRWVRTVSRFGYAFCGEATGGDVPGRAAARPIRAASASGASHCWLATADGELPLAQGDNVIGRASDLSLRLDQPGVSRRHACIGVQAGRATLSDLGSKNGTFVNGRPVSEPTPLQDEDELRLGLHATVIFRRSADPETETEGP
jgi:DNA-binding winged helix-turn-helix (wHTH) protein